MIKFISQRSLEYASLNLKLIRLIFFDSLEKKFQNFATFILVDCILAFIIKVLVNVGLTENSEAMPCGHYR